ncbi:MAG: EAL domain-containing protein [Gammaproteobacteria bacterium]|nr:EAL domain-containing protein [Gammaproteobacteria bacterium]
MDLNRRVSILERKLEREKRARQEAETILDHKSLQIYEINEKLKSVNEELDKKVIERTEELRKTKEVVEEKAHALKISNDRFALVVQASKAAVWEWNIDSGEYYFSPYMHEIFGYDNSELSRQFETLEFLHPDDREKFVSVREAHIRDKTPFELQCRICDYNGIYRWFSILAKADRSGDGRPVRLAGSITDIDEQVKNTDTIKRMARYDYLTEIPNRAYFHEKLDQTLQIAKAKGGKFSIFILDLNDFKEINDTLGHDAGDKLLVHVANNLRGIFKGFDIVARLGGDEFGIVLKRIKDRADMEAICESIIDACSEPCKVDGKKVSSSVSIGIAVYPDDGGTGKELLKHADLAMYQAKREKITGGTFHFFSRKYKEELRSRKEIETELRDALEQRRFKVCYQPKVELCSGKIIGAEALLRWRHPHKGELLPSDFIDIAEQGGLIIELGAQIIDTVCRDMKKYELYRDDVRIGINLSPLQFAHTHVVQVFDSAISRYGLSPRSFEIEITEGIFFKNTTYAKQLLNNFHEIGMSVSLDDFGTGYSSLSYLHKLPIDVVKIDRSFISSLGKDQESVVITKAIIELVHSLNLQALAEGIETKAQYDLVASYGCNYGQGFHIAKPVSASRFAGLLDEKTAINSR